MWFVHSFIHLTSIFECLLGPGTILGTWDVAICRTDDIDGGVGDDDDEKGYLVHLGVVIDIS